MKMRSILVVLLAGLILQGCFGNKNSPYIDPTTQYLKMDAPGQMVAYSPFWEVIMPGTILIEDEGGYDVLSDPSWLRGVMGLAEGDDIYNLEMPKPGEPTPPSGVSGKIKKEFIANFNAKLDDKNYAKAAGLNAKSASYKYYNMPPMMPKGASAKSYFNQFKSKPEFAQFMADLKARIGGRTGQIFVVTKVRIIPVGEYTIEFNKNITAEAKAEIKSVLNLSSDMGLIFADNKFTRKADPSTGHQPFMSEWQYNTIKLD